MRAALDRLAIIAILSGLAAAAWTFWPREAPKVGVASPLPPAVEVRTVEKIVEKIKYIKVYPDEVKRDMGLPDAVAEDPGKRLTTTAKLDADDRPYTLSTVVDAETGESMIYARPDPLPWLAPGKRGEIGIAYGLKNGELGARLYAGHELLRLKALSMGVAGTLDQDGDLYAGAYMEFTF